MPHHRMIALLFVGLAGIASGAATSCGVSSSEEAEVPGLPPELRRVAAEHPDSVVTVLVKTTAPLETEQRSRIEAAGLVVHTQVGDILTGRVRASDAEAVARLDFVATIQRSRTVPLPTPPDLGVTPDSLP